MTRGSGRVELKYVVTEDVAAHVLNLGLAFLDREVHAAEQRQRITSLYLDTPHRTFLRWHRARAVDRFKLRLRRYGEAVDTRVFAEVKRKTHSVVTKRRAPVPAECILDLLSGSRVPCARLTDQESRHLAEFVRQRLRFGAKPEVLVTCVRESLRGGFPEEENAITVDRDIRFQRMTEASLVGDASIWTTVPLPRVGRIGTAIVELKYGRRPPAWMTPLIMRLATARVSFSKYDVAMRHLCGER